LIAYNSTLSSVCDKHAPVITELSKHKSKSNRTLLAFRSTVCHAENLWKHTSSALGKNTMLVYW